MEKAVAAAVAAAAVAAAAAGGDGTECGAVKALSANLPGATDSKQGDD